MTKEAKLAELQARRSQLTPARRQQLAAEARAAAESFAGAGAELERMAAENEVWLAEFEKRYEELR
jgi:hypothetical protein